MTVIVGWRPFPWSCHHCGSTRIQIEPTNIKKDPQEIKVTCECGKVWFTSGAPIDLDKETKTWRFLTPDEELKLGGDAIQDTPQASG